MRALSVALLCLSVSACSFTNTFYQPDTNIGKVERFTPVCTGGSGEVRGVSFPVVGTDDVVIRVFALMPHQFSAKSSSKSTRLVVQLGAIEKVWPALIRTTRTLPRPVTFARTLGSVEVIVPRRPVTMFPFDRLAGPGTIAEWTSDSFELALEKLDEFSVQLPTLTVEGKEQVFPLLKFKSAQETYYAVNC